MKRLVLAAATTGVLLAVTAAIAQAGPNHAGGPHRASPACSISPNPATVGATYILSAVGLPAMSPINLFVIDPLGNVTGSPLGETPDGTYAMNESSALAGTTTYEFTGLVRNNTQIYATCSVDVH
jgi:hypothetical protein